MSTRSKSGPLRTSTQGSVWHTQARSARCEISSTSEEATSTVSPFDAASRSARAMSARAPMSTPWLGWQGRSRVPRRR